MIVFDVVLDFGELIYNSEFSHVLVCFIFHKLSNARYLITHEIPSRVLTPEKRGRVGCGFCSTKSPCTRFVLVNILRIQPSLQCKFSTSVCRGKWFAFFTQRSNRLRSANTDNIDYVEVLVKPCRCAL